MEKEEQINYIQKGWVHIKNFVPEFVVKELRERFKVEKLGRTQGWYTF